MSVTAQLPKRAFTVDEVAAMYSVSPNHIRRLIAAGELDKVPHMGRRVLVSWAELDRVFGDVA